MSTAHSEASSKPYPAAGQHFTLALGQPSYIGFDSAAVASCDKLEARDAAGQPLWQWEPGVTLFGDTPVVTDTKGFTSRLQGTVDFGIWGNGCNATEAKAGFRVTRVLSEESSLSGPPVTMTLPGQKLRHDGTVDNWYRYYAPELGRYLSPEPLLQRPSFLRQPGKAVEWLEMQPYVYARNRPLAFTDPDANITRQYRRDGQGNEVVRVLEAPLRAALVAQCKKEAEKNERECTDKQCQKLPPLPPNPSVPDLRQRDEARLAASDECVKGANCEYEACLAGATSASGTADYMKAWTQCMNRL